jgi:hypothetical protein
VGDELTEVDQVLRAVQLEHATCSGALDESNAKSLEDMRASIPRWAKWFWPEDIRDTIAAVNNWEEDAVSSAHLIS